ncbi:MAG: hypothetical protein QM747_21285 [Nocardioides sp.]
MYADTGVIRSLALRLRERAATLRFDADDLARGAGAVLWTGLAADAMLRAVLERARGLYATADAHEDAADALERHAREVDRALGLLVAIEARARGLVGAAGHLVARPLELW